MCRWFAYISPTEPCLLSDVLITPKHALTHQVNEHYLPKIIAHDPTHSTAEQEATARNVLLNVDGIGVAWYTTSSSDFELGGSSSSSGDPSTSSKEPNAATAATAAAAAAAAILKPAVYKTIQPPKSDLNFQSICANTETLCCMSHIRATSASAVVTVNNHPFTFGRISFMHNGSILDFPLIRRQICDELGQEVYDHVLGSTDSEHLAALYVHYLTGPSSGSGSGKENKESWNAEYDLNQMKSALHRAVAFVITTQKSILGSEQACPNSLNLAVTDGRKLLAYRFRNHVAEQPPSLYYSTKAGVTLNKKYPDHPDGVKQETKKRGTRLDEEAHGRHVIVASEPSTYKDEDWELIGKNQALLVDAEGNTTIEDIPYDEAWNAKDVIKPGVLIC